MSRVEYPHLLPPSGANFFYSSYCSIPTLLHNEECASPQGSFSPLELKIGLWWADWGVPLQSFPQSAFSNWTSPWTCTSLRVILCINALGSRIDLFRLWKLGASLLIFKELYRCLFNYSKYQQRLTHPCKFLTSLCSRYVNCFSREQVACFWLAQLTTPPHKWTVPTWILSICAIIGPTYIYLSH